jgi:predicted transcriptional regulator
MANEHAASAKIRVRTIIEILGRPKEHVEKTIKDYVAKIKEDNDFVVLKEHFSDAEEQKHGEDTYFGAFVELEFLVKGLAPLVGFCFNYMPSSVEIEKPDELLLPANIVNGIFNDLQARLHKVDMIVKQQVNENQFLRKNLRHSMRNLIVITLAARPMEMENLVKATGIDTKVLQQFVDELTQEEKLEKDGDTYRIKRSK